MLSKAVLATYSQPESDGIHFGQLTVTGVHPCAYATYLNYRKLDVVEATPEDRLKMKNGKWQEEEAVEELKKAGFELRFTSPNQLVVHVGRSRITGRPDGLIKVSGKEDLLEVKAMSTRAFHLLNKEGIDAFPAYKCQAQLYQASEELRNKVSGTWFYVKHRDSCKPYDFFLPRDEAYIRPIIEALDEIVLGGVEVKKPEKPLSYCPTCNHNFFCWKEGVSPIGNIELLSDPELVEKWLEAQFHLELGENLNEEVRNVIRERLKDKDVVFLEGFSTLLEARKVIQRRRVFSEEKFVNKYGAAALVDVMTEKIVEQLRITRRSV